MLKSSLGLVLALCILSTSSFPGSSSKMVTAVRTDQLIALDGEMNEPDWQMARPVMDFTQFDPAEGALPTEITSVRVLYDDNALYLGITCYDSHPEGIVQQLTRRDRTSEADRFTVSIDSYHDHQTAFVFSTNVNGVQSDGILSQDGSVYDISWDAVWSVKTRTYLDGWSAEMRIPFNALRFVQQKDRELEWGMNFRRYISRKHETDEWVMVPRTERLQISRWGHLRGLREISPPLHLSIAPYISSTSTFQSALTSRSAESDHKLLGGFDLKYGVTRNFTLDATVNPDFGQVEVDQAVLNLTVFETRYPEKRPFFVEGSQLFTFGAGVDNTSLPLFFSRRIGKRPTGAFSISAPVSGSIGENPLVTTILGAAKVSGRSNGGLALGALAALTDEERAVTKDSTGHTSSVRTEPRGSYNVVRIKQDFAGDSWVGGIATTASRENLLPSFSGGVDWNVRLDNGGYTVDGYLAGARSASTAVDRDGSSGRLLVSRIAAEHWFYTTSYDFSSRYFNPNDIGFFAQPHDHGGYVQLLYRENFAAGMFRRYSFALNPEYRWNWDGVLTHAVFNAQFVGDFVNFWLGQFVYTYQHPAYDDAERGIIGTYKRPAGHSFLWYLDSDERKNFSANLTMTYSLDALRKRVFSAQLGMKLRPASWMELSPVVFYYRARNEEAWVFPYGSISSLTGTSNSLFGDRDIDQLDLELRGIVTFTRNLSLQFFSQVFLARGKYTNYRRLLSSTELIPHAPPAAFLQDPNTNPDFNEITLNANVLLRWEYLPGSTIYLVWTQGRFDDSGTYASGFGQRLRDTFSIAHEDVLLLKVSYWLPF